ncbi:MAG: nitroreductase family protein [Deltaproteobacteria bacterium]|nr:nitroreductase family protein [Deltaproteobacteria bacterium]
MKSPNLKALVVALVLIALIATLGPVLSPPRAWAQKETKISLPLPLKNGGMPLNEAFNKRRSRRNFVDKTLDMDILSQILWSAFGVNREAGKMRTIPTSHNRQNLKVYAILKSGIYLYDGEAHILTLQSKGDFLPNFSGKAPLVLAYAVPIVDGAIGGIHVGSSVQNVGLYCASMGLGNVIKTTGVELLTGKLTLPEGYKILVIHSIGYPSGNY